MRRLIVPVLLLLFLASCGSKRRAAQSENRHVRVEAGPENGPQPMDPETLPAPEPEYSRDSRSVNEAETAEKIIGTALEYSGVRYQYGGTSRKGMDCSGLLYVAFGAHDIALPRVSHEMAEEGRRIRVGEISKGDLLFFVTTRRGRKINHVGLVVDVRGDDVRFIHSTTSRGVIVSSLREGFWNYAFVKATRVL